MPSTMSLQVARKNCTALRYQLQGAGFTLSQQALEYAVQQHSGLRKDGVTPEWAHPMRVAQHLMTLEATFRGHGDHFIAAALLHDVLEDKPVTPQELRLRFGDPVTNTVIAVSHKQFLDPDATVDKASHFGRMHLDPGAPLVKASDRINNQYTMRGVFSKAKKAAYLKETHEFILPMLGRARKTHPTLLMALLNASMTLEGMCEAARDEDDAEHSGGSAA